VSQGITGAFVVPSKVPMMMGGRLIQLAVEIQTAGPFE
jgi:hypothetical protein